MEPTCKELRHEAKIKKMPLLKDVFGYCYEFKNIPKGQTTRLYIGFAPLKEVLLNITVLKKNLDKTEFVI